MHNKRSRQHTDRGFSSLQDRIIGMRSRPNVGLFVDLDAVLIDNHNEDSVLAPPIEEFARTSGRLSKAVVYYTTVMEEADGLDAEEWLKRGITPVATTAQGVTKDDVNLHLLFDAHTEILHGSIEICILIVGPTDYTALARQAISRGITVILVGNYPRDRRVLSRDSCIYLPSRAIFKDDSDEAPPVDKKPSANIESYPFDALIRLLHSSEDRMPFVGARYFINKVMWRLDGMRTPELKQQLFQRAVDAGVVDIYDVDNVDGTQNKVSACRLNPGHELVAQVIESNEDSSNKTETKKVDVKIDTVQNDSTQDARGENREISL